MNKILALRIMLGLIAALIGAILIDKSEMQFLMHDVMKHDPDSVPSFFYDSVKYSCMLISAATIVFIYNHAGHLITIQNLFIKGIFVALLITLINFSLMLVPAQLVDIIYYSDFRWAVTSLIQNIIANAFVGIILVFVVPTRSVGNK